MGKANIVGYGIVILMLALYFGWLMDRMAIFSNGGVSLLAELGAGLVIGLLALVLAMAVGKLTGGDRGDEKKPEGGR